MKSGLRIFLFCLIIFLLMHYRKYSYYNENYTIDQQELDYVNGNELYNQSNPLIITFIEKISLVSNIKKYNLYSSITIQEKEFIYNTNSNYLSHNNEILLIRSKKELVVEVINPKFKGKFKKITSKKANLSNFSLDKKHFNEVKSIALIIREYNILFIPRHWLFKFGSANIKVEMYLSNNIFTNMFKYI
jgi:hypothetical protein